MKIKTQDLIGKSLNWAVALASGRLGSIIHPQPCPGTSAVDIGIHDGDVWVFVDMQVRYVVFQPDIDWSQGGPIIEREGISLDNRKGEPCRAFKGTPVQYEFAMFAPEGAPLIAAMRCFVASKLGDEVDVPEELL